MGKASFEARRAAALAMIEESEKGQRVRKGGVGAKKSQARLHHGKRANVAKDAALRSSGVVTRDSQASGYRNASAAGAADLNEDDAVSDDDSDAAAAAAGAAAGPPHEAPPAIDLRDGLFDTFRSESAHASLERMRQKYGFFLPDVEYLTDVDGLLRCVTVLLLLLLLLLLLVLVLILRPHGRDVAAVATATPALPLLLLQLLPLLTTN